VTGTMARHVANSMHIRLLGGLICNATRLHALNSTG